MTGFNNQQRSKPYTLNHPSDLPCGQIPTIEFIQEHKEWIEALQQEIAQRGTNHGGNHD